MFLKSPKTVVTLFSIVLIFSACQYEKLQPYGVGCDSEISCKNEVMPIINTYCIGCHSAGSGISDFTSWAGLKLAADNGSIHTRAIVLKDMPQAGATQITDEQRKIINCWIKQGARNN